MRRLLPLALAVLMLFSFSTPVMAANPYDSQGKFLKELGVLKGDESGNLMLDSNLTREQMVVMISRLYGQETEASSYVANNTFRDLARKHNYYIPYILWARDNSLIQGMTTSQFGVEQAVTTQQFQTVLLRALGYTEEAKKWEEIPALAEKLGIMKGLSLKNDAKLTRGQMAAMVVNTLSLNTKGTNTPLALKLGLNPLDITETATVTSNSVIFKGTLKSDKELRLVLMPATQAQGKVTEYNIPLGTDGSFNFTVDELELGKYTYRYFSEKGASSTKEFEIKNLAFGLVDVTATNLKEINIDLTKPVNPISAQSTFSYTTNAGTVSSVYFENENKRVVLVLSNQMESGREYNLSTTSLRSESGEALEIKQMPFVASDKDAPKVVGLEVLGTRGIRLLMSEPVRTQPTMSNFKFNVTTTLGNPVVENKTILLTYSQRTAALPPGNYSIETSGLEDYAGNKMSVDYRPFNIVKDTTPPDVKSIDAQIDKVTITFTENIDSIASSLNEYIYWKDGANRKNSDKLYVDRNKVIATFNTNPIPAAGTMIYIDRMTDYSGNEMIIKGINVKPTVDTTKPEVIATRVLEDGMGIAISYNKPVNASSPSNYSLLDSTGAVVNFKSVTGGGSEYVLNFISPLPTGVARLTIQGVRDSLNNTIATYNATFDMKDFVQPTLLSNNGYGNIINLEFSKPMDRTTLQNRMNYIITFEKREVFLPEGTQFSLSNADKNLTITLPETINGKRVSIGTQDNLTSLDIRGIKDTTGNFTNPLVLKVNFDGTSTGKAKAVDYYTTFPGKQAVMEDPNTIKIRFSMPITKASATDFVVTGRNVNQAIADGTPVVTLQLQEIPVAAYTDVSVIISSYSSLQTSIGTGVEGGQLSVLDRNPPRLISQQAMVSGNNIEIGFSKKLEQDGASLYRRDLQIIRNSDNKILTEDEFTTNLKFGDESVIVINIRNKQGTSYYSVRVKDNPIYIRDKAGNSALPSSAVQTIIAF